MSSTISLLFKVFMLQILVVSAPLGSSMELDEDLFYLMDQVSGDRMMGYIEDLTGFGTRYAYSEECNISAEYLYSYFASLKGINVTFHHFNISRAGDCSMNVVASTVGLDKRDEYVLLFAHYDSISDDPFTSAPGADDNACGVAVLMEVAYILTRCKLNRTLTFIAFSGEELGMLGSSAWVMENEPALNGTVAAICLDGVGRGDDISIMFADLESMALANLTFEVSKKLGFKDFNVVASVPGIMGSDSGPFTGKGFRVIRLWDRDTAYIHTPMDTPDTLNANRFVETAKVILATLYTISAEPLSEIFPEESFVEPEGGRRWRMIGVVVLAVSSIFALIFFYTHRERSAR